MTCLSWAGDDTDAGSWASALPSDMEALANYIDLACIAVTDLVALAINSVAQSCKQGRADQSARKIAKQGQDSSVVGGFAAGKRASKHEGQRLTNDNLKDLRQEKEEGDIRNNTSPMTIWVPRTVAVALLAVAFAPPASPAPSCNMHKS
eukprot:1152055-Pelagomonas_calceolata.AAC.7